ncbi:hypothetical protein MD484_g7985, partial [Candolleomyces efflorescens]
MAQLSDILSLEECLTILRRWQKDGPTDAERDTFVAKASSLLSSSEQVKLFQERVAKCAKLANDVDRVFLGQTVKLLAASMSFPFLYAAVKEWQGLTDRWRACIRLSCELATDTANILQRFDTLCLSLLETIETEQDRLNAIAALEPFIAELSNNDKSAEMSRQFMELKRDVHDFGGKVNFSMKQNAIIPLTSDIEA